MFYIYFLFVICLSIHSLFIFLKHQFWVLISYIEQGLFMLDECHDLFLQMAPHQFAKIEVTITTLSIFEEEDEEEEEAHHTRNAGGSGSGEGGNSGSGGGYSGGIYGGGNGGGGDDCLRITPELVVEVRHFLEMALHDIQRVWGRNISFTAQIPCRVCNKDAKLTGQFLNLDEIVNKENHNGYMRCQHKRTLFKMKNILEQFTVAQVEGEKKSVGCF